MVSNVRQYKCYGMKYALTVSDSQTRPDSKTGKAYHTVLIELAPASGKQGSRVEFDWGKKISQQVMRRELPYFLAFLMGWIDQAEWPFRGEGNNKSLYLLRSESGTWIGASSPQGKYGIRLSPEDTFEINSMCLRQLMRNHMGMSGDTLLQMVRGAFL